MSSNGVESVYRALALYGGILMTLAVGVRGAGEQKEDGHSSYEGLPADAIKQMERQAGGMKEFCLRYRRTRRGDVPEWYVEPEKHKTCVDGMRFYRRDWRVFGKDSGGTYERAHETAFDGEILYTGNPTWPRNRRLTAALTKYRVSDTSDPERHDTGKLKFPFLNGAGFRTPKSIAELDAAEKLIVPIALYYLRCHESVRVEKKRGLWQVSVAVEDPQVVAAKKQDLEARKKLWSRGPYTDSEVEEKLARLKRLRSSAPVQTNIVTLSPEKNYSAVARKVLTASGRPLRKFESRGWAERNGRGLSLPNRVTKVEYAAPYKDGGAIKVESRSVLVLDEVSFRAGNTTYKLSERAAYKKAGTEVADRTTAEARAREEHEVTYVIERTQTWDYIVIASVVAVSVIGLGWYLKQRGGWRK